MTAKRRTPSTVTSADVSAWRVVVSDAVVASVLPVGLAFCVFMWALGLWMWHEAPPVDPRGNIRSWTPLVFGPLSPGTPMVLACAWWIRKTQNALRSGEKIRGVIEEIGATKHGILIRYRFDIDGATLRRKSLVTNNLRVRRLSEGSRITVAHSGNLRQTFVVEQYVDPIDASDLSLDRKDRFATPDLFQSPWSSIPLFVFAGFVFSMGLDALTAGEVVATTSLGIERVFRGEYAAMFGYCYLTAAGALALGGLFVLARGVLRKNRPGR